MRVSAIDLGAELEAQARYHEAIALFRKALTVAPDMPRLMWSLGILLLREGVYEEGFRLFEARQSALYPGGKPRLPFPEWRGQPIKSLVILPDEGLGDQIMFARYIPVLRERGVQTALLCAPELERLFAALEVPIRAAGREPRVPRAEAWARVSSLPHLMGTTISTIPSATYLRGGQGGSGIGFVGTGNPTHPNDANRSLPPELVKEVLSWPDVRSLAPGDTGATDMEDTRRLIAELELVITVDTSVAHLAGSMGKPVWMLLPYVADWRWLRDRADSPWYPTARLYRQTRPGDWAAVLWRVRRDLAASRLKESKVSPASASLRRGRE